MSSGSDRIARMLLALVLGAASAPAAPPLALSAGDPNAPPIIAPKDRLRVCADPNNLPFSNEQRRGFENALAALVARDLDRKLEYTWWPQRRGFIRNTLKTGSCDIVMGIPAHGYDLAAPTAPYYRSTYVFVSRRERGLDITSFDDPRLKSLRIGIHMVGDDYNNPPAAQALAMHGLAANVRGYSIYGDYSQPDPPRALIDAVAKGDVDIAVAWGPLAGYFAKASSTPLSIVPVQTAGIPASLAMQFDIAMGVRRSDKELKAELDRFIARHKSDIRRLLARYGVPVVKDAEVTAMHTTER